MRTVSPSTLLLLAAEVTSQLVNVRSWLSQEPSCVAASCSFLMKVRELSTCCVGVKFTKRFLATSAIDYATDNIIQTSLREKLDKDVTLLTVAHRLQTIMDSDRIVRTSVVIKRYQY